MASYSVWNLVQPRLELKIKDGYNAKKIKNIMKNYILSDETVYWLKEALQKKMIRGLEGSTDIESLPMKITFVTKRYNGTEKGNFVSICAHSQHFTVTLVKLKPDSRPEIHKKDYLIDPNIFKKPHVKIYDAFAKCVKRFFIEYHLDGEIIPTSFCSDLKMDQYSLDTGVIPYFSLDSKMHHNRRDIKASFERVLQGDEYQDEANFVKASNSDDAGSTTGTTDIERTYRASYDAKLLGAENVKGLESTLDVCHNLLIKFQKTVLTAEEHTQKVFLDVSNVGVKIFDKVFKNSLYHHSIHKICYIVQDYENANIFGYIYGDFLKGHQFFGFKADENSTEIVSLLRNIFASELMRKKREKLEMQASQVFLMLSDFLKLAHEFKSREIQIPQLLKEQVNTVEDINWWLEGCFMKPETVFEEPKELFLNVRLQDLYATTCHLKLLEIQREAAAKLEKERLTGKRQRSKKKGEEKDIAEEDLQEKEKSDPLLVKIAQIILENTQFLENIVENQEAQLSVIKEKIGTLNDELRNNFFLIDGNLNDVRDFCFSISNTLNQDFKLLREKKESTIVEEILEREKIKYKIPSIYTGKKQFLKVTKKLLKVTIFEDIDFNVPKRIEKAKSDILNKIFTCEDYFLNSLKVRREEVEDLNYFISLFHFRESLTKPEDSKAIDYCRRFFIKAIKMRLKEIQDIEDKFNTLKKAKEDILFMVPDTMKYVYDVYQFVLSRRKPDMEVIKDMLYGFPVNLNLSEQNINMIFMILAEYKRFIESCIVDIRKEISEMQAKENSVKDITNICFLLCNQTVKMRKKEFDEAISDLDMLEMVDADTEEDKEFIHHCKEEYLTSACMREKEVEALEIQIETSHKEFKTQDSLVVTLKDLFYAAIEMEKYECEKVLNSTHDKEIVSDIEVLPVNYNFKEFFEVVAKCSKTKDLEIMSFPKDAQMHISFRDFLVASFKVKQKQIEIPISVLKTDFENVLIKLIKEVQKRHKQKQIQSEIHDQAVKISQSWKEVFLLALDIREKEMNEVIASKKREIKEQGAILKSMKSENYDDTNHEACEIVRTWKKIFSVVAEMKSSEMKQINEILKSSKDREKFSTLSKTEIPSADDVDEGLYEVDDADTTKKEKPAEEVLEAIKMCKHIYDVAINKGSTQLEEMEHEMRPIFSVEDEVETGDVLLEDEVAEALNESSVLVLDFIENAKIEVSTMKTNLESLLQVEENIKSQVASAKSTCNNFLTLLLELEENAFQIIEEKLQKLNEAFQKVLSKDSEKIRPFTDLVVDVLSDEENEQSDSEPEHPKKEELVSKVPNDESKVLTKEEIQSVLLDIESELDMDNNEKQLQERQEAIDIFETCKQHLELSSEMRRKSIDSIIVAIEMMKIPDPKKMKAKEKINKALHCVVESKENFQTSINFRLSELKIMQANFERMKATQKKDQVVVEYESSEIIASCQELFLSAVEARKKNISMMKNEIENLEAKECNLPMDIKSEAKFLMKSEIYIFCKDLVLESVDLKMKEIDDITSHLETLNNMESKIGIQLKHLNPEKHKAACVTLEKTKDDVATCKKLCVSAAERAKKEVRDTDEELQLLKGALETSETSLITATCKNLLTAAIEKREMEISELEFEFQEMLNSAEDTLIMMDALILNDSPTSPEENLSSNDAPNEEANQFDVELHTKSDVKELKNANSNSRAIEQTCKMKINMVIEFLSKCKEHFHTDILRKKEEIAVLESDLDKIKVTVQKVEGEDHQVFSVCQSVLLPIVQMRFEEIKSFEDELNALEKLVTKSEPSKSSQKADENQEVSEVSLAIASCKRALNLAIKNRQREKDSIDFELMKFVRFQDSRITSLSKQFFLTALQKASEEMAVLRTNLLIIEDSPIENESEILEVAKESLKILSRATKQQIDVFVIDRQFLAKKKRQMEIEESQFVLACKKHFSSQVDQRLKEITIMIQEIDSLSENQSYEEGFDVKILSMKILCKLMYASAISTRKKETEDLQCELIKHYDIKVSEVIHTCERHLQYFIDELKDELKAYDSETEEVTKLIEAETNEICTALCILQSNFGKNLNKRSKDCKIIEEALPVLQGKKPSSDIEQKYDVKAPLKEEACFEKLKTSASIIINDCKEILYSVIEVADNEIQDLGKTLEEFKSQEQNTVGPKKQTLNVKEENSTLTDKEFALLKTLERNNLKSKSAKNPVIEFCDQLYMKSEDSNKIIIQTITHFLEKLSDVGEELVFQASKLIYFMINLYQSVHKEQVKEKKMIKNNLSKLEDIKIEKKYELSHVFETLQEIFTISSDFKKNVLILLRLSIDSLREKKEDLNNEISKVCRECVDIFIKLKEMVEISSKHLREDLENLKAFGSVEYEEDESKLSEDEKSLKKCRSYLLSAVDHRSKLAYSINLQLKFLKGRIQERVLNSIFPSWRERFLALLGEENKDTASETVDNIMIKSQEHLSVNSMPSRTEINVQKLENFKDLLKSLEQQQQKLPIYTISNWEDLLLRSFLTNQIEENRAGENEEQANDTSNNIIIEKNWEELFYEADNLLKKEMKISMKLKESRHLSAPISSWSEVFCEAISEWSDIMKKETAQLKNENCLLQWKGKMKSKEILEYSSGSKYGFQSKKFDKLRDYETTKSINGASMNALNLDGETDLVSQPIVSKSDQDSPNKETINKDLSSLNCIFSKYVDLIEDGRKAFNFMRKKKTKLQSQVINVFSSWDKLFSKAFEQRKVDLLEEMKERSALKGLAEIVNEEMEGKFKEERTRSKDEKFASWVQLIYDATEVHKLELLGALNVKKSEMEKSSWKSNVTNSESSSSLFLSLEPQAILEQGKKLMAKALEIRKKEIEEMKKELKSLESLTETRKCNLKMIPLPVLIWKLIVSIARIFKASGQKFEPQAVKGFAQNSKDLFIAAMQGKMKEMENSENYWKKFAVKPWFLEMVPTSISWSEILESVSILANKDIAKMSVFGIRLEPEKEEPIESKMKEEDIVNLSSEAPETIACWTDLILEALELENESINSGSALSRISEDRILPSWDEIFFFMNEMHSDAIKENFFSDTSTTVDHLKLKNIRSMVSSNFFSWDVLLIGVIEEALWTVQEKSENERQTTNINNTTFDLFSLLNDSSENIKDKYGNNITFKNILKQLGIKSYVGMLPSEVGSDKFKFQDSLSKARQRVLSPDAAPKIKELKEEHIWKCIFPIAVEVWRKNMKNYLNFEVYDTERNYSNENSHFKTVDSDPVETESTNDTEQLDNDFDILKDIEKVLAFEHISNVEDDVDEERYSEIKQEKEKIKSLLSKAKIPCNLINNIKKSFQSGENLNPEYFYISASWHEMFKSALEKHKQFLIEVIDLQEDFLEAIPCTEIGKPVSSKEKKLKFHAANILNQEITLPDLFEIVDALKRENLVTLKKAVTKDTKKEDIPIVTSKNLEVSKVIDAFAKIFEKALKYRLYEKNFIEKKHEKLMAVSLSNCEKYRAYSLMEQLIEYFHTAVKSRINENQSINLKLESLNEFKCIFSGYLECPVTESLLKRNDKYTEEMNSLSHDLKKKQECLMQHLRKHMSSLLSTSESYLRRRSENIQLVDLDCAYKLLAEFTEKQNGNDSDFQGQEIFSALMKIFSCLIKLRNEEVDSLQQHILDWKNMYKYEESVENSMHNILSSILKFFENERFERDNVTSLLIGEKHFFQERETELSSKLSLIFSNCKNFLLFALAGRKEEISSINNVLISLKNGSTHFNKKTQGMIALSEEYCHKFVEKRESEIRVLETLIDELNETEISQVQSLCLEYFSQAIANRKSEQAIIDERIESCQESDENVESELNEAIDEALADIIDLSSGKTFFHALSEKKDIQREKVDSEVLKKCSDFFAQRKDNIKVEIKSMEESTESLKILKGNITLCINMLHRFEALLDDTVHAVKEDNDRILSEQDCVIQYQHFFFSEILECLISCRKIFKGTINDIKQDIYILKLQLSILSEKPEDVSHRDILVSSIDESDDQNYDVQDVDKITYPGIDIQQTVDSVCSEESNIVKNCYEILKSALEFRINFIITFSREINLLNENKNKAFHALSSTTGSILNMSERRIIEQQRIEAMLVPFETVSKTSIVFACMECLSCLLKYDTECLAAIMSDFDRLQSTTSNMEKKRSTIFSFCHKNLQSTIDLSITELENIKSEVVCMERMQTDDDFEYVTSTKLIFQKGVDFRSNEITAMKNALDFLKTETEILPLVNLCKQHFKTYIKNRKEEIISVEEQIKILDDEAAMLLLVYAPALEGVLNENEKSLEKITRIETKLKRISLELVSEEGKIFHACQKLYCNMLETFKIEREVIKHDLDSLQEVELENRDIIDTEGKEIVISFKDLYLSAFNLKKSELERDIRKQNVEENVKMKKCEIVKSLQKKEGIEKEEKIQERKIENDVVPEETFEHFVQFYDIKKENRRLMIEEKIMNEFETIEQTLTLKSQGSFDMAKYSEENIEEIAETKTTTEQSFNRVFEVKMREVEEKISYFQKKITAVINKRKGLLEDIILVKRNELENNIFMKKREMQYIIDSITDKESNVICSLKDLFEKVLQLKNECCDSVLIENMDTKFIPDRYQAFQVSVKLEKFVDIVTEVKNMELQMMLQSRFKDLDKMIVFMRKEAEKLVVTSKEKLEEALKQYRRSEKTKAMEYAVSGGGSSAGGDDYVINENEIFPDLSSFKQYVDSFKDFFVPKIKKNHIYEDKSFRSEEIQRKNPARIALFRSCLPPENCVPNHVLKLLDVEIDSLTKILFEMNLDKAKAILHGLSFISAETVQDVSSKRIEKAILLDIVSVLNDSTSMLMLGSFFDNKCDISLCLDKDCNLVYFEKSENIKKWHPLLENVKEVAINVCLQQFGSDGCLDTISTKFDWAVTTLPISPSRFEKFISDAGLSEQIKFAFLELHHQHLLCRGCNFTNLFEAFGLSFDRILKLLNVRSHEFESTELFPLSSGTPSPDDVAIANYVCKVILMRGALMTAICLSTILQRLEKREVTIITTSFFIQESYVYQKILKIYLSYLCPEKKVHLIFCKKSNCGIGASIMASVAKQIDRENPGLYLAELEQHIKNRSRLFSIQSFMKLLSDPNFSNEANHLAHRYMKEMNFDLPLAVVWAYHFMNDEIEEAANLCKLYPISLLKVNYLVCRKISFYKNLDLAKTYIQFLKTFSAEQRVKESAYKVYLDMLFHYDMYQEAIAVIQECIDVEIPLAKLRYSTLAVLHNFCVRESSKKGQMPAFSLPTKDFDSSSTDSDTEENNKNY